MQNSKVKRFNEENVICMIERTTYCREVPARYIGWSVNSINQIYEFTFCKSGTARAINFNNAVLNNILQKLCIVSITWKIRLIRHPSCYAKKLLIKFTSSFIFYLYFKFGISAGKHWKTRSNHRCNRSEKKLTMNVSPSIHWHGTLLKRKMR